ncbi:hypothetical protein V6N13_130714 [Hibiscus sabdariffa]
MAAFIDFLEDLGLLNLSKSGKAFTWYGGRAKESRLDRFLVSTDWVDKFGGLERHNLSRGVSDHAPVNLSSGVVDWGPKPFRFLNCWLERHGHVQIMEYEWRRITETASSSISFVDKLRSLKAFLKVLNR